jgi:hypothetical protein
MAETMSTLLMARRARVDECGELGLQVSGPGEQRIILQPERTYMIVFAAKTRAGDKMIQHIYEVEMGLMRMEHVGRTRIKET